MEIKLRKRKFNNLRKLVKVNEENEVVSDTEILVNVLDVDDNVLEEGTPITSEMLSNINWKDTEKVEYLSLKNDILPDQILGINQIVSKSNGEIWVVPGNLSKKPYPLGEIEMSEYIKGQGSFQGDDDFEYSNLDNKVSLISNDLEISTTTKTETVLDSNQVETLKVTDKYKIEINPDNGITAKYAEENKLNIKESNVAISNYGANILLDSNGDIKLEGANAGASVLVDTSQGVYIYADDTLKQQLTKSNIQILNKGAKVELNSAGKVSIAGGNNEVSIKGTAIKFKSDNTDVAESSDGTKFNCHTDLVKASYGNKTYRMIFYNSHIMINDAAQNIDLLKINSAGKISAENGSFYNGSYKTIDTGSIKSYVEKYAPDCSVSKYFMGSSTSIEMQISGDSGLYYVGVSSSYSGAIIPMILQGTYIDSYRFYNPTDGYNYQLVQQFNDDTTYLRVEKYNSSGSYAGVGYIRLIYRIGDV